MIRFTQAIAQLRAVAGEEIIRYVSERKSSCDRSGVWELCSRGGVSLATVDVHNNVTAVHAMPTLTGENTSTARVNTTRVACQACGQPKVLQGRALSGADQHMALSGIASRWLLLRHRSQTLPSHARYISRVSSRRLASLSCSALVST